MLRRGFPSKSATIKAICLLALSGGFLGALSKAVICECQTVFPLFARSSDSTLCSAVIPADHSSPNIPRPWEWLQDRTKVVYDPIAPQDTGPQFKKLLSKCREAPNGWPSLVVLTEDPCGGHGALTISQPFLPLRRSDVDIGFALAVYPGNQSPPFTLWGKIGSGCISNAGYCFTGQPGDSLVETMEELATHMLADLERVPEFFTANSAVGGKLTRIPPTCTPDFTANPATFKTMRGWQTQVPPVDRAQSELLNGSLLDSKITDRDDDDYNRISAVTAAENLAGRHTAEVQFVNVKEDAVGEKPAREWGLPSPVVVADD